MNKQIQLIKVGLSGQINEFIANHQIIVISV